MGLSPLLVLEELDLILLHFFHLQKKATAFIAIFAIAYFAKKSRSMLAIFSNSAYPPEYRFRDNLAPAGVADKIYNRSAVINCTKLSALARANLCRERIGLLQKLLKEYRRFGNGLREVIEVLKGEIAQEKSWENRIEILHLKSHPDKIRKNTSPTICRGLISEPIIQVVDIGQTSKGVFYLRYERLDRRMGCSFVARKKLLSALSEIQSQREGKSVEAKRLWLASKEFLGIEFVNDQSDRSLEIKQTVCELTSWIMGDPIAQSPSSITPTSTSSINEATTSPNEGTTRDLNVPTPSKPCFSQQSRVRSEVWSALMDEGLIAFVAVDDGEVFFRVHRHKDFLGVIVVDGEGIISILSSTEGSSTKVVNSPTCAVESLVSAFSPISPKNHPPTITLEDWEALKDIVTVKGTKERILTTEETLSIVLDPKYLRPALPGETPSPRMVLCEHYMEIRRQLSEAVAARAQETGSIKRYRDVWEYCLQEFDDNERSEINRLREVYPREAKALAHLFETVKSYEGFKLADVVVQPFSVCVTDDLHKPLARFSISAFSHSWQIQRVLGGYFSNASPVDSLESAIANLFQARHQIKYEQLVLQ